MSRRRALTRPLVAIACAVLASAAAPALAQSPPRSARLGVAHVDNMDLHVSRQAGGPPAVVEHLPAADLAARYRTAGEAGVGWHRWSIYWDLVDRGGTFDWAVADAIVERDAGSGLRTLAVLQGNPPGVAVATGRPPGIDEPVFRAADGSPTDDPAAAATINGDNTWARFVAAVVDRYRPGGALAAARGWPAGRGVRAWEIGNEPNLPFFWPGTPEEYARFLEVGYLAARWRDPSATIVHAGIANDANADAWFGRFLDALVARAAASPLPARHGYYFDRTAWHYYTVPSKLTVATPARVQQMLAERGLPRKGLWVTELGAPVWSEYPGPCWDPASPLRVSTVEQAGFVWQAAAESLAAGAELIVYFQLYDDCGNGLESYDAFGLVRNHEANQCWRPAGQSCWRFDPAHAGTPRPSHAALAALAREIDGASVIARGGGPSWRSVVLQRSTARVTVAWAAGRGGLTAALPAAGSRATLYRIADTGAVGSRELVPSGGRYAVDLSGATNRNGFGGAPFVDGRPVLLVEHGVAGSPGPISGAPSSPASSSLRGAAAVASDDRTAPYAALVRELPATSPPVFQVSVVGGDAGSGLGAFQLYHATGAPPRRESDWTPTWTELAWPGTPLVGQAEAPFVGAPGVTYYFTVRARDRAGNWSPFYPRPQAWTRIVREPARPPSPGRDRS